MEKKNIDGTSGKFAWKYLGKEDVANLFFIASYMIGESKKIKNSIFLCWLFEKLSFFCLDRHEL